MARVKGSFFEKKYKIQKCKFPTRWKFKKTPILGYNWRHVYYPIDFNFIKSFILNNIKNIC